MPKDEYSASDWQSDLETCYTHEIFDIDALPKEVLVPDSAYIIKIKKLCADAAYKTVFEIFDEVLTSDDDPDCRSSGDEAEWMDQRDSTITKKMVQWAKQIDHG